MERGIKMIIACFIVLVMILGVLCFDVFEPKFKRKKYDLSEKDKKQKEKLKREVQNFLSYNGDKQS